MRHVKAAPRHQHLMQRTLGCSVAHVARQVGQPRLAHVHRGGEEPRIVARQILGIGPSEPADLVALRLEQRAGVEIDRVGTADGAVVVVDLQDSHN